MEKEEVRVVEPKKPLGSYSDNGEAYVEHIAKEINDIVLDIYIPHNAEPKLAVGRLDKNDSNILFAAQAADIRADNQKITGAYVRPASHCAEDFQRRVMYQSLMER